MTTTTPIRRHERDMIRRAERAWRAKNDPRFGKGWPAGEMGRNKSKAARNKAACRKGNWD